MFFNHNDVESVLQKVVDRFLIPRFKELGMMATGEWEESIEIVVGLDKGTIRGRQYSEQLAKGRKYGKRPPIAPLERWVNAKFGISGKEATSMAFAIAKKIEKEGTTWYQKGGSDLIEVLEEPKTIQFIQDELAGILKIKIEENLQRNAQNAFL